MDPLEVSTELGERHPAVKWLFAVAMAALALLIAMALRPALETYTLLPDIGAVVLVAWFAGLRPALLTTGLTVLATTMLLIEPAGVLALPGTGDVIRLVGLVLVSLTVSWASHSLRSARLQAEARTREVQRLLADVREQASALEEQAVELEQQVETAQRALERAEQSEAALQQANRELSMTTYAIAHDLRSPLRAVDGFSAMLTRRYGAALDDHALELLGRIRQNVQRMGMLMDGLLSLARLGRGELAFEGVDLTALAREIVRVLAETDPARRVHWSVADGMRATGDPRLLSLLLQNLLGNAWKFTRHCDPAVISVDGERDGDHMTFVVRDNGVGFDMEHADQLFRPFHRLHADGRFEGTGIGLATARRIVERHGGRIWAESHPGEGTAIRFTLAPPAPQRSSADDEDMDGRDSGEVHSARRGQPR